MRIVFTVIGNSRRSNYLNGDTLRYGGGGGSGGGGGVVHNACHSGQGRGQDRSLPPQDRSVPLRRQRGGAEGRVFWLTPDAHGPGAGGASGAGVASSRSS